MSTYQDARTGHGPSQVDDTIPLPGSTRTLFEYQDTFDHSAIPLETKQYPVIVIGSSMVGMSLGAMLGYHGQVNNSPHLIHTTNQTCSMQCGINHI